MKNSKRLLAMALLGVPFFVAGSTAKAADDSCEDYFMRHNKADLVPTGVRVSDAPRSGDLAAYQQLTARVKNVGNLTLELKGTGGIIAANMANVSITYLERWRRILGRRIHPTVVKNAFIPAPLGANQSSDLSVSLPADDIRNCEKIRVAIDVNRTAGQHGCQVFANDAIEVTAHRLGQPRCFNVSAISEIGGHIHP